MILFLSLNKWEGFIKIGEYIILVMVYYYSVWFECYIYRL